MAHSQADERYVTYSGLIMLMNKMLKINIVNTVFIILYIQWDTLMVQKYTSIHILHMPP